MLPQHFTTQRLVSDTMEETDKEFILELLNTEGWLKFIGDRNVHSTEDAVKYIQKIKNTADYSGWVVREKETGVSMGVVSFIKRKYLDHFDIGFAFLPRYSGKGYAYEAAEKLLSLVIADGNHLPVLATTMPGNKNSIKLLTRLGMHYEREITVDNERLLVYST